MLDCFQLLKANNWSESQMPIEVDFAQNICEVCPLVYDIFQVKLSILELVIQFRNILYENLIIKECVSQILGDCVKEFISDSRKVLQQLACNNYMSIMSSLKKHVGLHYLLQLFYEYSESLAQITRQIFQGQKSVKFMNGKYSIHG